MPKTKWLKDKDAELRKLLFPDGVMRVSMTDLSKRSGIPESTLYRCRQQPTQMHLDDVHTIAKIVGVTQDQIWRALA